MLNFDFVCFGVLSAIKPCNVRFRLKWSFERTSTERLDDGENPDLGDWAFNTWSWNYPLPKEIRWAMWWKGGKKKKTTEEKVGQVKPLQGKDLTSPLCGACLEECPQPHSRIAALQIHHELAMVASMHNEGPEGPHGESSATCVMCTARLVNRTWLHGLLLQGPNSAGVGSLFTSRVLFVSFNPVSGPSSYLPKSTFSSAQGVLRLCFMLGALSTVHTLTCLSSDFG